MTKIVAISDLHGHLPMIPPCDILLIAGDLCPVSNHSIDFQSRWLDKELRGWLMSVPARHVVGIAGNHDFIFQRAPVRVPTGLRWTYLEDSGCTVEGLRLWGTPWQRFFQNWAFNAPERDADGEAFLAEKWELIPDGPTC